MMARVFIVVETLRFFSPCMLSCVCESQERVFQFSFFSTNFDSPHIEEIVQSSHLIRKIVEVFVLAEVKT